MGRDVLVSIAMTCYNQAHFVLDAIRSVVAQTHQDWEIVVVDDYSTDASLEVIWEFVEKLKIQKKVKIISHEENKGYGSSLREAIGESSGELVVVLDSDDILAKDDVLEICVGVHNAHPDVSMTYSNYIACYEDLKLKSVVETRQIEEGESYLKKGGAFVKNCKPGDELCVNLKISHLKVFKRRYYDMTVGIDPNLRKTVDKDLVFKLEEVGKFKHINEFLMLYRKHANSLAAVFGRSNSEYRENIEKARKSIYDNAVKRRRKNDRLRIFIDGSRRPAVSRMFSCWEKLGHTVVDSNTQANIQLSVVRIYTKTKLPTLLRIDGVYYDKAEDFNKRNVSIGESHSQADVIVYQSETSKLMCERHLEKRTTSFCSVIYNGVCGLRWVKARRDHEGINVISCAKWRRVKRLPEMIEIFQMFLQRFPQAKLHIIGPMAKGAEKIITDNVTYYDELESKQIKEIYTEGDVHLHLCKKDSCPSNVPESIAAGIPVVTTNLCGGAAEMCSLTPGCAVVNEGAQFLGPDYIYQEAYNKIPIRAKESIVESMSHIVRNGISVELPPELSIEYTAKKYLNLLKGLYERNR